MENEYFPNDSSSLNRVMSLYEKEIQNRKEWINNSVVNLNSVINSDKPLPSDAIHYATSIINHAMVVVRIIDRQATSAKPSNKNKAKERANILHQRNSGFPDPPEMLRKIRNDYEHFEERMDYWATNSINKNYVDLSLSNTDQEFIKGIDDKDMFRSLKGKQLTFWDKKVDLQEVIDWVAEVSNQINADDYPR